MSLKFPMKGSEMQSLYTMAWNGKPVTSANPEDPMFSGYQAEAGQVEDEETEMLEAPMTVRAEGEPTVEEVETMRNRKFWQAQRVLHLFQLGYTDL